eukprot:scaffold24773_cov55-Phaeocystis_antarctica.AAC.2
MPSEPAMMTEVVMPQKRPCSKTPHLDVQRRTMGVQWAYNGRLCWPRPTAAPRCHWLGAQLLRPPECVKQPRPKAVRPKAGGRGGELWHHASGDPSMRPRVALNSAARLQPRHPRLQPRHPTLQPRHPRLQPDVPRRQPCVRRWPRRGGFEQRVAVF